MLVAVMELGVVITSIAGGSIYKAYEVDKTVYFISVLILCIVTFTCNACQ